MGQLVVVSNRVAVPERNAKARAGGLEVAVKAALKHKTCRWFGWSGKVAPRAKIATQKVVHDKITYITLDLSKEDHQEYYNGFTNRVLWPILHYRVDLAEFSRRDLSGYLRVNDHFARGLHEVLAPDDFIWVHDYHLIPLAQMLRERGSRNRIGYFLHVPLPPPEILTALPNHERLIPQLTAYDLVGFQTEGDADNFARYLERECRLPRQAKYTYRTPTRTVRIGVFPIGIEAAEFSRAARRAVRSPLVRTVVESLASRAMVIGVDRLDYSKGLTQRLEAFEQFLALHPAWRGKVTYLQITPRSRSEIREYADMARTIGEAAGRINGTYGEAAWTPIRYVNRAYTRNALAGLYRSARVGLVTPLRDGMNLVAKEYIAAQDSEDPGVLVLSRFAGAAAECSAALIVNPYDPEAVANSIAQALTMPLEERRARHAELFRVVGANDLQSWTDGFLDDLTQDVTQDSSQPAALPVLEENLGLAPEPHTSEAA